MTYSLFLVPRTTMQSLDLIPLWVLKLRREFRSSTKFTRISTAVNRYRITLIKLPLILFISINYIQSFLTNPEKFKHYAIVTINPRFFFIRLLNGHEYTSRPPQLFLQRELAPANRITISFLVRVLHHQAGHVENSRKDSTLHNPPLFSVNLDNILELYETRADKVQCARQREKYRGSYLFRREDDGDASNKSGGSR